MAKVVHACFLTLICLFVIVGVGACVPLSCAKSMDRQLTVQNADGQAVTLSLWRKEKLVKLPFFDGDFVYVKCGDALEQLHNGEWVANYSSLRLSADRTQLIAYRTGEHSRWGELLIDLQKQQITRAPDAIREMNVENWTLLLWHTPDEHLSHDQLRTKLGGKEADAELARDELVIRAQEARDWLPFTRLLVDQQLAPSLRRQLMATLFLYGPRRGMYSPEALSILAIGLEDPDAEIQLETASLLADFAAEPPTKDVPHVDRDDIEFRSTYDKVVPVFRQWWKEGSPATQPAKKDDRR